MRLQFDFETGPGGRGGWVLVLLALIVGAVVAVSLLIR